jgi:hypothetical protein
VALELHHCRHLRLQERQGGVYDGIGNRLDGFRFPGLGPAALRAGNSRQGAVDGFGNQFLGDGLFEQPANPAGPLVDDTAGQGLLQAVLGMLVAFHHQLADGFLGTRADVLGRAVA